jgi:hypothetical protein
LLLDRFTGAPVGCGAAPLNVTVIVAGPPLVTVPGLIESPVSVGRFGGVPLLCTFRDTPFEVSPVVLFFSVTVKVPADKIACPDTCVLPPPALMPQGGLHPGPLKNIVLFDASKLCPVSVMVKPCPLMGGLGEVEMLEIDGVPLCPVAMLI